MVMPIASTKGAIVVAFGRGDIPEESKSVAHKNDSVAGSKNGTKDVPHNES